MKTSFITLTGLVLTANALAMGSPSTGASCDLAPYRSGLTSIIAKRVPRGSNGRGAAASILRLNSKGDLIEVGYEKNANVFQAVASTQKIMTAWVTTKYAKSMNSVIRFTNDDLFDDNQGGRATYRKTGQTIDVGETASLNDYLYTLITNSSNGSALALSRGVASTTESFVTLMNNEAYSILGASRKTYYQNPNGLTDDEDRYRYAATNNRQGSTAHEMALIIGKLMGDSGFRSKMSSAGLTQAKQYSLYKLGFTQAAGRTVVMHFPNPKSGCGSDHIAIALFGENSSSQFTNFQNALNEIRALLAK